MKSNDLSTLFTSQGGQGVEFRQGTILYWDSASGENQVSVGGSVLFNVRVLNTGEAIALKPGHVVGILKSGTQWFIVGRISVPESSQFAGASVSFYQGYAIGQGFSVRDADSAWDTPDSKASARLYVPGWANQALIFASANVVARNTLVGFTRSPLTVRAGLQGSGSIAWGPSMTVDVAYDYRGGCGASRTDLVTFSPTHSDTAYYTIHVGCQIASVGGAYDWATDSLNYATVSGFALFRSTE